jgi:predicted ester cyclase
MTPDEIKALLQRLHNEVANGGKWEVIPELFDEKYASRYGVYREQAHYGHEVVREMYQSLHTEFAEFRSSINAMIIEGELAASNWTCTGIYQGEPTETVKPGQKVTWSGTSWWRVRDGKILERWSYGDDLTPVE